jgi:hypothetical protein
MAGFLFVVRQPGMYHWEDWRIMRDEINLLCQNAWDG